MSIDNWTKLLGVLASLLQGISWPLIILFALLFLRIPLKKLLQDQSIGNFSFKAGPTGFEATIQRQQQQQIEAAALLGAATVNSKNEPSNSANHLDTIKTKGLIYAFSDTDTLSMIQLLAKTVVLWGTSHPEEDTYVQRAIEAIGIRVRSTSMNKALQEVNIKMYDIIILAVQTLLEFNEQFLSPLNDILAQKQYDAIPIVIYFKGYLIPDSSTSSLLANPSGDRSDGEHFINYLKQNGISVETEPIALFDRIITPIRMTYLQQLSGDNTATPVQVARSRKIEPIAMTLVSTLAPVSVVT